MDDLKEILERNPQAAEGLDDIRRVMRVLKKLREAGFAGRTPELGRPPRGRPDIDALTKNSPREALRRRFKNTLSA